MFICDFFILYDVFHQFPVARPEFSEENPLLMIQMFDLIQQVHIFRDVLPKLNNVFTSIWGFTFEIPT
jgi:hypothetical protein